MPNRGVHWRAACQLRFGRPVDGVGWGGCKAGWDGAGRARFGKLLLMVGCNRDLVGDLPRDFSSSATRGRPRMIPPPTLNRPAERGRSPQFAPCWRISLRRRSREGFGLLCEVSVAEFRPPWVNVPVEPVGANRRGRLWWLHRGQSRGAGNGRSRPSPEAARPRQAPRPEVP